MNILNLAIDQESVNVIEFIADTLTSQQTKALWTHKYAKDMSAVHQAASLGNLAILKTLTEQMGCNVHVKMQNNLSVMHCAAQTYGGILSILFLQETFEMGIN